MIVTTLTESFVRELAQGLHNLDSGGDSYKCALYEQTATLNQTTEIYTASGEVSGTNYNAGGNPLINNPSVLVDNTGIALFDFEDLIFGSLTVPNIAGCLIYNETNGNRSVAAIKFDAIYSPVAQGLTITFPSVTSTTAFIRISNG